MESFGSGGATTGRTLPAGTFRIKPLITHRAAAAIAVTATATVSQLGFIHEDPGQSFVLDIADLYRDTVTIPAAFRAAKADDTPPYGNIERLTRREVGRTLVKEKTVPRMIDRIKELFEANSSEAD